MRRIALLALLLAGEVSAQTPSLQAQVEARLREAGPGPRFGLLAVDDNGHEVVSVAPDGRFVPASNTKMFTTAAAFATLPPRDPEEGTAVRLEPSDAGWADVVLEGHGDPALSSAPDCTADCLATLADAVAARTRTVHDVVGDDTLFPDERWPQGMSWNNIPTRSGTGISALTLDDNELVLTVTPAASGAVVSGPGYYAIDNRVDRGAKTALAFDRAPNGRVLRLSGTIAPGAAPERLRVGIDDPADYAAWTFQAMLRARGVRVTGRAVARHRPLAAADDPAVRGATPPARPTRGEPLARLVPPALGADVTVTNKLSQNLHAELLLRRIGLVAGSGSVADGLAAVRRVADTAGVPRTGLDLSDGSGMSTYNRMSPRAGVALLRWIAAQPWGAEWRASLPVAGVDGTLARRFPAGSALSGKLFAKTGSLNATSALSGWMVARSGRTLTFSAFVNDVPDGTPAVRALDEALAIVAAAE